jgi:hypothetical protein
MGIFSKKPAIQKKKIFRSSFMENLQNKSPPLRKKSFCGGAGASFNGFIDFCKRNTPLVITVSFAAIFVYGLILFNITATGDNAAILNDPGLMERDLIAMGRWTTEPLLRLFFIKESGIYASNFIFVFSIWLFSILFCYFIAVLTKNTERRNGFIPLALIVLTYSVWPQYFQCFLPNKIRPVFICLTLINVYLLFDGLLSKNKIKTTIGFVLSILTFGEYEPFVPLFLCITFIYFVLLQENSNLPSKEYALLCLKLFIAFIAAFAMSTIIGKIIKSTLIGYEWDYVTRHFIWNKSNILSVIFAILAQGYIVTIGALPFVHNLFSPIIIGVYGGNYGSFGPITELVFNSARAVASPLLLPAAVLFLVMVFINAKKRIPQGRRLLYILAGFGVPCSIFLLAAVSGELFGIRTLYALPFAAAFMFYYVSYRQKKVLRRVFYCMILGTAFYQAQISQNLLETAVRVSDYDTMMAFDIGARIRDVLENGKKPPVAYIGKINHPLENQVLFNMMDFGASNFNSWSPNHKDYLTGRVRPFMGILGFNYGMPAPPQTERAYEASRDMPSYPENGCVKNLGDVIVVKIGE